MVKIREWEQLTEPKISIKSEARIVSCQVVKEKLITQLDDGREVIIAISLLTKWGVYIYFPDIDDTLPARIISDKHGRNPEN